MAVAYLARVSSLQSIHDEMTLASWLETTSHVSCVTLNCDEIRRSDFFTQRTIKHTLRDSLTIMSPIDSGYLKSTILT